MMRSFNCFAYPALRSPCDFILYPRSRNAYYSSPPEALLVDS
jgi:hypothetical protein